MNEADLLLVLGASFANHTGIYPGHPIIQVDLDPLQLGKFHPVTVPGAGATSASPPALADGARRRGRATDQRGDVAERWALWRAEKASRAARRPRRAASTARRSSPPSAPACPRTP